MLPLLLLLLSLCPNVCLGTLLELKLLVIHSFLLLLHPLLLLFHPPLLFKDDQVILIHCASDCSRTMDRKRRWGHALERSNSFVPWGELSQY
jgi:hypothetical protein